jgi:hypothetical protein
MAGIGQGMVTSNVVGSTYRKPPEDDPSTLVGYKARLAAQRAEEEGSYRNRRNLQLQYEQEDKARALEEERAFNEQRRRAFETIYRPQFENEARTQWAMGHMGGRTDTRMGAPGYALGKPSSIYSRPVYGRPDLAPPGIPMAHGTAVYGGYWPQTGQVQQALNTIWGRTRAMETAGFRPQPMTALAPTAAQVYGYGGSTSKG